MKNRLLLFLLPFLSLSLQGQPGAGLRWQKEKIAPGLYWQQVETAQLYDSPQSINLLRVNTRRRKVALAFVTDTLLTVSSLAGERGAIAAVNAGFFKIKEGKGSAAYLRVDGVTVDDLPTQGHGLLNGALLIDGKGRLEIEYARPNEEYNSGRPAETVLATGPVLLLDGQEQPLAENAFNDGRHPRTCLCLARRNKALLVTIDGRHEQARGMSLPELSRFLLALGCKDAINLDGGGSTTMWIAPEGVVNHPSDNKQFDHEGERPVANALIVNGKEKRFTSTPPSHPKIPLRSPR